MSLRVRLTVTVAAIVAVAVIIGALAARYYTARALRSETDAFLVARVARVPGNGQPDPGEQFPGDRDQLGPLFEPDAIVQVLMPDRRLYVFPGEPRLPVDATDARMASQGGGHYRLRDVTVGGEHYRMLTAPRAGGGIVQIARSTHEMADVLGVLRNRFILIALVGTVFAAFAGWLLARRTTRPIEQLTDASEHVARTQDLTTAIPVEGDDEVGRLARSFNTMLEALATSRVQQRRLIVDASHELRTPLTAIRTNMDLLGRGERLDPSQRAELISETRLELDELTEVVAELVDLATDARSDDPIEPIDLEELAHDVANRFRRRSGREITVQSTDAATIDGRRAAVDRALSNLVDNALKFSADDTPVEIVVEGSRLEVRDRGPGVPAGEEERVFDRFYRADTSRTLPGSGLGLSIVRQVAELHGGAAELAPREGGGSVATLTLPG
jgi:two-component system, OmpR family, sensor histidine kinase MprB